MSEGEEQNHGHEDQLNEQRKRLEICDELNSDRKAQVANDETPEVVLVSVLGTEGRDDAHPEEPVNGRLRHGRVPVIDVVEHPDHDRGVRDGGDNEATDPIEPNTSLMRTQRLWRRVPCLKIANRTKPPSQTTRAVSRVDRPGIEGNLRLAARL